MQTVQKKLPTTVNIDFSYKENPLKVTYDIESTPNLFTLAMIHDKALTLIIFGDHQFDDLDEDDLKRQMYEFASKKINKKLLKIKSPDELDYYVKHYKQGNDADMFKFMSDLSRMQMCRTLDTDVIYGHSFVEYHGWNSANYDLIMIVCIKLLLNRFKTDLTPQMIRKVSNAIVLFDGRPKDLFPFIQTFTEGAINAKELRKERNIAIWFDGHIDWAAIARQQDQGEESQYPPALKTEMAKFGLDIIIDESVADDSEKIWTDDEKKNLVEYNFNDVLGTRQLSRNKVLLGLLASRDIVRRMFHYTSARAVPFEKLHYIDPSERDCTAANLAGLTLIGPDRVKPIDWDTVRYEFPVPDGKGGFKKVDLLDYMVTNEPFMHPHMYTFFDHFRGKDTRKHSDDYKVKQAQPITHGPTINIPYYRDGKPTDSVITVSTGGAHGFVKIGLRLYCEEQLDKWIRSNVGASGDEMPTVDVKNILHADWQSFYPMMASKMGIYVGADGIDRMVLMIKHRLHIKDVVKNNPDESKWTDEIKQLNGDQKGIKFVMNSATGAGNQHNPYALLPVDNKTLSMRLVGNLLIWCLAQRLTQAGAFVISTNTDGIYFANMEKKQAEKIIEDYVKTYGMEVDPEDLERFINRDVSNRIEFINGHRNIVSGRLKWGDSLHYTDDSIGRSPVYPLASCHAALEYMNDSDWLQKPYDPSIIRNKLREIAENDEIDLQAWYHVHKAKSISLTLDGKKLQKVNRIVLTKLGGKLGTLQAKSPTKDQREKIFLDVRNGNVLNVTDVKLPQDVQIIDETDYHTALWQYAPNSDTHESIKQFVVNDVEYDYVQMKKKKKFIKRQLMKPNFVGLDDMDLTSRMALLVKKDVPGVGEVYDPVVESLDVITKDLYDTFIEHSGATYIGYPSKKDPKVYLPLKMVKAGENVSGYTSKTCQVVNTAKEVDEFDKNQLDLEAYALWAENLLAKWKVSANSEELAMRKIDDVVVKSMKQSRQTKASLAKSILEDAYRLAYANE